MSTKKFIAAALFALAPFAAQAALTTLPAGWPPAGSSGLAAVQFNQVTLGTNGAFVAMGAHAYKNSPLLPNDGVSTYYAKSGIYPGEPTKNYANWSFDFAYDTKGCSTCSVFLEVDRSSTAGVDYMFNLTTLVNPVTGLIQYGPSGVDSWNMEMGFMTALVGNFDPYSPSSTAFRLSMVDTAQGSDLNGAAAITVNVPEPGTMALAGLALAGMTLVRRRKALKR